VFAVNAATAPPPKLAVQPAPMNRPPPLPPAALLAKFEVGPLNVRLEAVQYTPPPSPVAVLESNTAGPLKVADAFTRYRPPPAVAPVLPLNVAAAANVTAVVPPPTESLIVTAVPGT
jgi:hypothetical protein